jgi:hypothetical protein
MGEEETRERKNDELEWGINSIVLKRNLMLTFFSEH